MPKITLLNPSQIPPYGGGRIYPRGYSADVAEDVASELAEYGLIDQGTEVEPVDEPVEDDPIEDDEPADDEPEETPKPAKGKLSRPKQVASVAVWREYAESLGLKVTGMTKPEIIGAVDAAE